jgi:hypothetical protein
MGGRSLTCESGGTQRRMARNCRRFARHLLAGAIRDAARDPVSVRLFLHSPGVAVCTLALDMDRNRLGERLMKVSNGELLPKIRGRARPKHV